MKCLSCSGVNPEGAGICQFCGDTNFAMPPARAVPAVPKAPQPAVKAIAEINSISRIATLPANPFRWLPFLFHVYYLAGHGRIKLANNLFLVMSGVYVLGKLVAAIMPASFSDFISAMVFFVNLCYWITVAVRIDSLVKRGHVFNWGMAIGYGILYSAGWLILAWLF